MRSSLWSDTGVATPLGDGTYPADAVHTSTGAHTVLSPLDVAAHFEWIEIEDHEADVHRHA